MLQLQQDVRVDCTWRRVYLDGVEIHLDFRILQLVSEGKE
jgi:hypothetical protein